LGEIKMSIKNPHIIHKLVFNKEWLTMDTTEYKYKCIRAVHPTYEKSTHRWVKVTCKNCLRGKK